jgi:hypothetical protein
MFSCRFRFALLVTVATVFFVPTIASAKEDSSDVEVASPTKGERRFGPDFFASYAPVTALDMVKRIPGFSINEGGGRRGFGENAGNVLIDGDRPSTKTDDILTILSRIPASQVESITLSEQAGADTETQGQGQVVNVVRKRSAKVNGTYEGTIVAGSRYGFRPSANGSASLAENASDVSHSINPC